MLVANMALAHLLKSPLYFFSIVFMMSGCSARSTSLWIMANMAAVTFSSVAGS
jgi:uncharacterized lipoprotein YajG